MANMNFGVNILPKANNTYTLGNSDYKWNIYANTLNGISLANMITDVQINGTSILNNHIATIPIANANTLGVVSNGGMGIGINSSGSLYLNYATDNLIKAGTSVYNAITAGYQHQATFYGLAKAAGDSTQSASSNAVGNYTSGAKTAIQNMLAVAPKASPVFTGSISLGRYYDSEHPSSEDNTIGTNSIVVGIENAAVGNNSQAFGSNNYTSGFGAMVHGNNSAANGMASHAEGIHTWVTSNAWASHAEGCATIADNGCMHVSGQYNVDENISTAPTWAANTQYKIGDKISYVLDGDTTAYIYSCITANNDATFDYTKWKCLDEVGDFVEIVGNGGYLNGGEYDEVRSNARALDWSGNEYLNGYLYVGCNANSSSGIRVPHDIQINNTSIVSNGIANIPTMTGATSSVAGSGGLVPAPTTTDVDKFLAGDGTYKSGGLPMVILSYGNSTWQDFIDAYNNNVIVYCRASSNSNPKTGSQTRMAFMAYVSDASNPTNVEFQYYRSMNSHSATAMGDQVFVYKLDKTSGWSVTTRDASIKEIKAGTNEKIGVSWSSNVVTLSNTMTANDMPMSSSDNTTAKAAIEAKYTKPSGGIPAADLAETYLTTHQDITMKVDKTALKNAGITSETYTELFGGAFSVTTVQGNDDIKPKARASVTGRLPKARKYRVTIGSTVYNDMPVYLWFTNDKLYEYIGNLRYYISDVSGILPEPYTVPFLIISDLNNSESIDVWTDTAGTYSIKIEQINVSQTALPNSLIWDDAYAPMQKYNNGGTFNSLSIGVNKLTSTRANFAVGYGNIILNESNHILGFANTVNSTHNVILGSGNGSAATKNFIIGENNSATGTQNAIFGFSNNATGLYNVLLGQNNTAAATGSYSVLSGFNNVAYGFASYVSGILNTSRGAYSRVTGMQNIATGAYSQVSGLYSVSDTSAYPAWTANTSYAVGDHVTTADGQGYICATANSDATFTSSKWASELFNSNKAFIIGNGTADNARSNAMAIDWAGNQYLKGDIYINCNADSSGGTRLGSLIKKQWELINEETITKETEADYIITTDSSGNAFELTDIMMLVELPKLSEGDVASSRGTYGQVWFYYSNSSNIKLEPGAYNRAVGDNAKGAWYSIRRDDNLLISECTGVSTNTNANMVKWRFLSFTGGISADNNMGIGLFPGITFTSINIKSITGNCHYKLYGRRV